MPVPSSSSAMNEFSKRASTVPDPSLIAENRTCPGCNLSVINENGGVVVAFGQSFFHVDCFKCAKCGNQVTADTNLLLLSDGSPICANCSYSCNVCKLPILDEAIMTGDDSYHAHCFKCKVCGNRIDELVFAKTSQGIYCMSCHNQRVARSRRHQQKKKEQAAAAAATTTSTSANGSGSGRSRELQSLLAMDVSELTKPSPSGNEAYSREPTTPSKSNSEHYTPQPNTPLRNSPQIAPKYQPSPVSQIRTSSGPMDRSQSVDSTKTNGPTRRPSGSRPMSTISFSRHRAQHSGDSAEGFPVPPLPGSMAVQRPSSRSPTDHTTFNTSLNVAANSVPVPNDSVRRISHDDGSRPMKMKNNGSSALTNGAGLQSKRQSVSPAPAFDSSLLCQSPRGSTTSTSSSPNPPSHDHLSETPSSEEPPNPDSVTASSLALQSEEKSNLSPPVSSSSPEPLNRLEPTSRQRGRTPSADMHYTDPWRRDITDSLRLSLQSSPTADQISHAGVYDHISVNDETYRVYERLSPLPTVEGSLAQPVRSRSSFDDRPRISPAYTATSSGQQNIDRSTSMSHSSTSPSHHVDAPIGMESDSDTEGFDDRRENDQVVVQDVLPALPSKGLKGARPPRLNLESSQSNAVSDISNVLTITDIEEQPSGSELSRESSPIEQTSHATFIAPALPPIRFSMSGSDFSDFMKFGDGQASNKALVKIGEVDESSSLQKPALTTPSESVKSSSPASETTIIKDTPRQNDRESETANDSSSSLSTTVGKEEKVPILPPDLATEAEDTPRPPSVQTMSSISEHGVLRRSPTGSQRQSLQSSLKKERKDSNASLSAPSSLSRPHHAHGNSNGGPRTRMDTSDLVVRRLREALSDATENNPPYVKFDKEFVEAILMLVDQRKEEYLDMKTKLDGMKRASLQYMDGLSVAQAEYEREVRGRRDAQSEVTRLRVLLSGQAMKLTALSGESRRNEAQEQLAQELSDKMTGLERDLSILRVERDMTLVEMEELSISKGSGADATSEATGANLNRNITTRLDKIKKQYKRELLPLTQQRERLDREIEDLKTQRDLLLEETTVLNVRNEELEQLTAQYVRRAEAAEASVSSGSAVTNKEERTLREKHSQSFEKARVQQSSQSLASRSSTTLNEDIQDTKLIRIQKPEALDVPSASFRPPKFLKWSGKVSREHLGNRELAIHVVPPENTRQKTRNAKEHTFQQVSSGLRIGRCEHCGDKMWGSLLRCSSCNTAIHPRCLHHLQISCSQHASGAQDELATQIAPLPPSMFGRELAAQVRSDAKGRDRTVPVIVEKCIEAVDCLALDYEGIYRKTGGSGQSKVITQLFERGQYAAFDLQDTDRFNDICSVTSVLKTYFRSLPNPLFTYALHDGFVAATNIRDPAAKTSAFSDLVMKMPREHYYTARMLMLHLHRVSLQSETNLMTPRNLGVVFGPTLMRSVDPSAEFSDMAGKALTVEWLVENAPTIFTKEDTSN